MLCLSFVWFCLLFVCFVRVVCVCFACVFIFVFVYFVLRLCVSKKMTSRGFEPACFPFCQPEPHADRNGAYILICASRISSVAPSCGLDNFALAGKAGRSAPCLSCVAPASTAKFLIRTP